MGHVLDVKRCFTDHAVLLGADEKMYEDCKMNEERLVDIEIKLARSDDMLEELNKVVYEQQKKIDRLEVLYAALLRRVPESADDGGERNIAHEKPPHY
jgi:SlyX protein